jgi:hypothetical protein
MKITAHFHGILADWVGTCSAEFELPHGAIYADLIQEIGRRFRGDMLNCGTGRRIRFTAKFWGSQQIKQIYPTSTN